MYYSLRPEILVLEMDVSRLILVIDTIILFISKTSISGRREYYFWSSCFLPLIYKVHTQLHFFAQQPHRNVYRDDLGLTDEELLP